MGSEVLTDGSPVRINTVLVGPGGGTERPIAPTLVPIRVTISMVSKIHSATRDDFKALATY